MDVVVVAIETATAKARATFPIGPTGMRGVTVLGLSPDGTTRHVSEYQGPDPMATVDLRAASLLVIDLPAR